MCPTLSTAPGPQKTLRKCLEGWLEGNPRPTRAILTTAGGQFCLHDRPIDTRLPAKQQISKGSTSRKEERGTAQAAVLTKATPLWNSGAWPCAEGPAPKLPSQAEDRGARRSPRRARVCTWLNTTRMGPFAPQQLSETGVALTTSV